MITKTITRIEKSDLNIVVVVRFDDGLEPIEKHYTFTPDDDLTLVTLKEKVKPDLDALTSVESKINKLSSAIGKEF